MKKYVELQMGICYMENVDVLTYSIEKDNDVDDGNWFDD